MRLPAMVRDVRKSVAKLLNKPSELAKVHQGFKAEQKMLALWAADCA
jgi:hypothetical protein